MGVGKEKFFREMTLDVSSSLDINVALERVLRSMQKYIPLNQLHLSYTVGLCLDGSDNHCVALASDGVYPEVHCYLHPGSKPQWEWIQKQPKAFILSASDRHKGVPIFPGYIKEMEKISNILVPLRIDDDLIGFLWLWAMGPNKFNSDHVELLETIANPFALALSNANSYGTVLRHRDILIDDNRFLNKELLSHVGDGIIGGNSGLRNVMEMVQQVARQNTTVLLVGETGTGKEGIANAIHSASARREGPLIKVNCGAISESLIDDELFGHEKGAFTGAVSEKRGRFERACGGTFFLDEIGELPLQSQVRLLRVLQSKKISRVGGEKPIPVDVRIIAATNRNLKEMVSEGQFREDLWFRLNVFPITLPPLRQRKEVIPALIRHFVALKSKELSIAVPPAVAPGAYERLTNYNWPGNVRELENLVERELIWHRGGPLKFDSLLPDATEHSTVPFQEGPDITAPLNLDEAMSIHIGKVLKMARGKIHGPGGAAELLGINPNTLRGRMRHLGILHGYKSA